MHLPEGLETALRRNIANLPGLSINEVVNISGELHMNNIQNREVGLHLQDRSI